jgi:hypothetical protein
MRSLSGHSRWSGAFEAASVSKSISKFRVAGTRPARRTPQTRPFEALFGLRTPAAGEFRPQRRPRPQLGGARIRPQHRLRRELGGARVRP